MKSSYFTQSIIPGFSDVKKMEITVQPEPVSQVSVTDFSLENKPILVLLEPVSDKNPEGISEQSMTLLKKIFAAMHLSEEKISILENWPLNIDKKNLVESMLNTTNCRTVFLIGASVAQHFLGVESKISQIQGQIFEEKIDNNLCYIIPLFHPDFITLNHSIKNLTWESVKKLIPWIEQQLTHR